MFQPSRPQRREPGRDRSRPRDDSIVEAQQTLWVIRREGAPAIRAVIVAFTDAVELEIYSGDLLRRRLRFLRDLGAVRRAHRIHERLLARGYRDVRPAGAENRHHLPTA